METMENLKKDIEFINDFTSTFFNKISILTSKANTTLTKIDSIIEVEKTNEVFLKNLESTLTDTELANITQSFDNILKNLDEKQNVYISLIQANSSKIANISQFIKQRQPDIDRVNVLAQNLESSLKIFESKTI